MSTLRRAFGLWEAAADATLFELVPEGHPVSFVFDERQETAQRRNAERAAAEVAARELESARGALEVLQAEDRRVSGAYEDAVAGHTVRTRRLNGEITRWNQRSQIPDSVRTRLEDEREALAEMAKDLDRMRSQVEASNDDVRERWRQLNRQIEEYNRGQERLARAAGGLTQAGRYDEEITTRAGLVEDVRRQIRVFRYDGADDLVFVLAHELGHALGLGHVSQPGAVMSEVSSFEEGRGRLELHSSDMEMLDLRCPGLGTGGL